VTTLPLFFQNVLLVSTQTKQQQQKTNQQTNKQTNKKPTEQQNSLVEETVGICYFLLDVHVHITHFKV
jgi:hypothetical protein